MVSKFTSIINVFNTHFHLNEIIFEEIILNEIIFIICVSLMDFIIVRDLLRIKT